MSQAGAKQVDAAEAVSRIRSHSTVAVGGAGGVQEPDLILSALVDRYRREGAPTEITEFHPIRTGEMEGRGTSVFGEPGMVARMIGGSFWPVGETQLVERICADEITAYNFPIGIMYALLDAAGAGRPGVVSPIGLGTFVDPALGGGALNPSALAAPLVRQMTIDGSEQLFYPAPRVDTAIIRGTTADADGNVTMEHEPAICGPLLLARAAKASGGRVIVQVKHLVEAGTLDPRDVVVPAPLVDDIVVHPEQMQTTTIDYDPTLVGDERMPLDAVPGVTDPAAQVILRRAMHEIEDGETVGIGFGVAGYLPAQAIADGRFDRITFTIEHGLIGGINGFAAGGVTFPMAHNPDAIIDAADQLAWYASGALDHVVLGIGEVDVAGNLNVSRFGRRIPGCGGFIEMTHSTQKITFCGALRDRPDRKIVHQVEHMTFNAARARQRGQQVRYITEQAVFELGPRGLVLIEHAPNVAIDDLRQRLAIVVSDDVRPMAASCFASALTA